MSFEHILFQTIIEPLVLLFELVYGFAKEFSGQTVVAILWLSLVVNLLCLPLYQRADAIQRENREKEKQMAPWVKRIKAAFKGDERFFMLQAYYRICGYKQIFVLKNVFSLLLQIPFFIVAYKLLSGMSDLHGQSLGPIADLGAPDGLLIIGGTAYNVLPVLMTAINLAASWAYFDSESWLSRIQFYGIAFIFLILLYGSASGLVLYWTLNQIFSLLKNIINRFVDHRATTKIMTIGCAALCIVIWAGFTLHNYSADSLKTLALYLVPAVIVLALLYKLTVKYWAEITSASRLSVEDDRLFFLGGGILAVLAGVLIPSAVICSSPLEFISLTSYVSPLNHVLNSFLIAAGLFIVWFWVFYYLARETGRRLFALTLCGLSLSAVINYMFFGTNLGLLTPELRYENTPQFSNGEVIFNEIAAAAVFGTVFFIWLKAEKIVSAACSIALAAVVCMSCLNIYGICGYLPEIEKTVARRSQEQPNYTLSKTGKNVVVLMLDRAISGFVPYMFSEKPGLERQFAGFTYYPNTISYGHGTINGAPGLYGGYEYRPEEMNERDDLPMVKKHNEAVTLMPLLFDRAGYDVTVCDPPYAGYSMISDLSIYDEYPGIKAFNTGQGQMLNYLDDEDKALVADGDGIWERNFFCYGVMKMSPLAAQMFLYHDGKYFDTDESHMQYQVRKSASVGYGVYRRFLNAYSVLNALPKISRLSEDSKGGFLIMDNETPHRPTLLSEPDYRVALKVNNRAYDKKHAKRFTLDGRKLKVSRGFNMAHYHANMATMIKLGEWLDYLRQNNVYDNTKIILVSDHGYHLKCFEDMRFGKTNDEDVMWYNALLMVKDFNSNDGFVTDDTFMTNADTPTIAFEGVIENPVNPFTGKAINSDAKQESEHHIFRTSKWQPSRNDGNKFARGKWYCLYGDDLFDMDKWEYMGSY